MNNSGFLAKIVVFGGVLLAAACERSAPKAPTVTRKLSYAEFLQPEPGPFVWGYGNRWLYEGYGELYASLFKDEPNERGPQMVIDRPSGPVDAVFLAKTLLGTCAGRAVTHIKIEADRRGQPERHIDGRTRELSRVSKTVLDCETADLIDELWDRMLCEVRVYPMATTIVPTPSAYHFSSWNGTAGLAVEPRQDTLAGRFVAIGEHLIEFVDSEESARASVKVRLVGELRQLLSAVRARNAQLPYVNSCGE